MRTIKFRAWDKTTKLMMDTKDLMGNGIDIRADGAIVRHYPYDALPAIPPHDFSGDLILMQFTGLLDKNGKEIYENDLVDTGTKRGRVKFLFGCWHFVDGEHAYLLYPKEEGYESGGKWKYIEVIGNIYENPELLSPAT